MTEVHPSMRTAWDQCQLRRVDELPLILCLITRSHDRFTLGKFCPSGPDEANMAMWSDVYQGGRILASYILHHQDLFAGKNVIDVGCGSGLVGIMAAKAGASVVAIDSSWCAIEATEANAAINKVELKTLCGRAEELCLIDFDDDFEKADIITAADVFYTPYNAMKLMDCLGNLAREKIVFATSQDKDLARLALASSKPWMKVETWVDDQFQEVRPKKSGHTYGDSFVRLSPR